MAGLSFLSLNEFQPPAGAKVYRHRAWTSALWLALLGGFSLFMLYVGWRGGLQLTRRDGIPAFVGWAIGITWGLASWWIFGSQLKARLKPTNWLAMRGADGLYLKYRSIMNAHFPAEDMQIVFLPFSAISGARIHQRKWATPTSKGSTQVQRATFVELCLRDAADAALLADRLAAERTNKGPRIKTWYGSRSLGRRGDYPVQVMDGNVAITWGAQPDAQGFLADIADKVAVSDAVRTDYNWRDASTPEAETKAIRSLGQMGETFPVIAVLERKFGMSLTQAKQQSEEIKRQR